MDQMILDRAVKLATHAAMHGHPVDRIVWIPPSTPAQDPMGAYAMYYAPPLSASELPSWEK
jgi:hypothetical protein